MAVASLSGSLSWYLDLAGGAEAVIMSIASGRKGSSGRVHACQQQHDKLVDTKAVACIWDLYESPRIGVDGWEGACQKTKWKSERTKGRDGSGHFFTEPF